MTAVSRDSSISPAPEGRIRASVVVCTRNRRRALVETLEAVLALSAPFPWELVVVDNSSTDDTLEALLALARRALGRMRVVSEPVIGLSAARNCGVRIARGDWIAFLDDDAIPVRSWLEAYEEALAGTKVMSAGGPVEPRFDGPLPAWLEPWLLPYLTVWDLGPAPLDLRYNELPRGANMTYRREAFERVGGFDLRLGRAGGSLRSCEEIELGLRLERAGFRSVYAPAARVVHAVAAARLTPEWFAERFAAQGFSEAIIDWKHFGWEGLQDGFERMRRDERPRLAASPRTASFPAAERRAYRRGALYAVAMVERWQPPA